MKWFIPILAVSALSACGGATTGGGSSVLPTSTTAPPAATTPPSTSPPSSGGSTPPPTGGGANNASFATLLNDVRLTNGAGNVAFDARLANAAQGHADDMRANNYFSHTGLNGSSPGDRITAAGYNWRTYGENIARGQQSEEAVMTAWTNSPGHHANNINPNFEDFALAKAGSGSNTYWVLVLASEQ